MSRQRAPRAGTAGGARRKHRSRPVPRWLKSKSELDAIARSRCLMVLSVLSGEKPVTDAIIDAKISRGTYYQMETRALNAMLRALNPLAPGTERGAAELAAAKIEQLEATVKRLEQENRRSQRLLLLHRKVLWPPMEKPRRGRPPTSASRGSSPSGKLRWRSSRPKATPRASSTLSKAGEGAR